MLEEMFGAHCVDGTGVYVTGQDFFDNDEGDELAVGEDFVSDDFAATPTSSNSMKRSLGSLTSTCDSPVKKTKIPMVRYIKQISTTFSESVQINQQIMQQRLAEKEATNKEKNLFSVKRCQELAAKCGIGNDMKSVMAMGKLFKEPFQREFFCGLQNHEARLNYFNGWCQENNLS